MKKISLILLSFMLIGCDNSTDTVGSKNSDKMTYLALGDSYTIGESVDNEERWPVQLVGKLNSRGHEIAPPTIIARTGWTTQDLLNAIESSSLDEKYDLVSILIGVNNQFQNKSIQEYEEDLKILFEKAIDLSARGKKGVFVLSIPDYGATPFGAGNAEEIGRELTEFNAVLQKTAEAYNLPFYNITPISQRAAEDSSLIAEDNLHPSGKMYRLWVEEIIDEVAAMLPE